MVQAPTPVTVGGKERLLTGDSVLEEVDPVGVPLGGSSSLTQRLREETPEKSKCGSGVKFTEDSPRSVIFTHLQSVLEVLFLPTLVC